MCRVTENQGFYQSERDRLKIKAFYLRLSVSKGKKNQLPESLTLLYLPRINESPLEINDTKIRSDSSGFITLYRMRSEEEKKKRILMMKADEEIEEVIYASREKVRVSEGVRFEVYSREDKILKGVYRKDVYDDWKLESKCVLENDPMGFKITEAEIFVSGDGNVSINEKIEIVIKRRRKNNKKRCFKVLEEIPEDREEGEEKEENESSDGSCSCCCCDEIIGSDSDDTDCLQKRDSDEEGSWTVDVGIWVMCLGVGYLVSKASSRTLRRRRRMVFR